jgi:catechol 2,3-dioxygenase-like lactoylglutathione lyase family enzyme
MTRPTTPAISPCFIVSNVDETIAFYRNKLGFETSFREPVLRATKVPTKPSVSRQLTRMVADITAFHRLKAYNPQPTGN